MWRSRNPSFFWPALLILAGVVALLVNTGAISSDRLYELVNLWPLILPAVPWTISENTGATNGKYQLSRLHVTSLSIRTASRSTVAAAG